MPHIRQLLTPEQFAEHQQRARESLALEAQMRTLVARIKDLDKPKTLLEVGTRLKIGKERVRQLEKLALHKLRQRHPELNPNTPERI